MNDRRPQLEMRWLPVTDELGRTHMEAVWFATDEVRPRVEHVAA